MTMLGASRMLAAIINQHVEENFACPYKMKQIEILAEPFTSIHTMIAWLWNGAARDEGFAKLLFSDVWSSCRMSDALKALTGADRCDWLRRVGW